jgi:hypothetical protein
MVTATSSNLGVTLRFIHRLPGRILSLIFPIQRRNDAGWTGPPPNTRMIRELKPVLVPCKVRSAPRNDLR